VTAAPSAHQIAVSVIADEVEVEVWTVTVDLLHNTVTGVHLEACRRLQPEIDQLLVAMTVQVAID
jgi:hypothetical protein